MSGTTVLEAVNDLREAAARGLPDNSVTFGFRSVIEREIERVSVSLNEAQLCRIGRMIQNGMAFVAEWTETKVDDKAAELVGRILDEYGCPD